MRAWLAMAVAGACVACQVPEDAVELDVDLAAGVELTGAAYHLTWHLDGASVGDDGALQWTTDLGYDVRVDRAYVVAYRVSLAQCDDAEPTAYVWHGEDIDPSSAGNLVEAAGAAAVAPLEVEFDPATYCRVHYLVARADGGTSTLPDDANMDSASLVLSGAFAAPGSDAWQPLSIATGEATGVLEALADTTVDISATSLPARAAVQIDRSVGTLLDGARLDIDTPADVAWQALRNLRENTVVSIEIGS